MYQSMYLNDRGLKLYKEELNSKFPKVRRVDSEGQASIIDNIISTCYRYFDVDIELRYCTKRGNRKQEIIRAKQFSMYFIKKCFPKLTLTNIGLLFSSNFKKGMDHSSVIHAVRKIEGLVEFDNEYAMFEADLKKKVELLFI